MKTIRWGLIGCGDVAERKSGPAFSRVEGSTLAAVASRRPDSARQFAARHGAPRVHERCEDLIADPEIDAVYIATPPAAHEEWAVAAARAGKAVYVEKPMARTFAECERMIAAARTAHTPLCVAYYRRRLPKFLLVKEFLEEIGPVREVELALHSPLGLPPGAPVPWRLQPGLAGPGGHFMDLASHQLDLIDFFFGPIRDAKRTSQTLSAGGEIPDRIAARLTLADGAAMTGDWRFDVAIEARLDRTTIRGEDGEIRFSTFDGEPVELMHDDHLHRYPVETPAIIQEPMIAAATKALREGEPMPCDGETGARANAVIENILKG